MDVVRKYQPYNLLPKLIFVFLNVILSIPESMLNRIQAIINRFIWGNKRPRINMTTVEKTLRNGEVAIPNIKNYYHAAMLVACLVGWKQSDDETNLILKQENCNTQLSDWLVQDTLPKVGIVQMNRIGRMLVNIWLNYRKYLIPLYSPFQKFMDHLEFIQLKHNFAFGVSQI